MYPQQSLLFRVHVIAPHRYASQLTNFALLYNQGTNITLVSGVPYEPPALTVESAEPIMT